uniref:Uncharacterized protein n=1 Tax=Setaria italica TaxID=4555 RepID=K3YFI0_SETIT
MVSAGLLKVPHLVEPSAAASTKFPVLSMAAYTAPTTLGFHTSVPVGSWSESAPFELSRSWEPDETCTSAGSGSLVLAYQTTVLSLVLSNQTASR